LIVDKGWWLVLSNKQCLNRPPNQHETEFKKEVPEGNMKIEIPAIQSSRLQVQVQDSLRKLEDVNCTALYR
jgi:hypothetical protein